MTRTLQTCVAAVAAVLMLGAGTARADVVLDWNATMLANVSMNPFGTARVAAITQLAVFEAVNAVTGDYEPYLGTVAASPGASAEAAAAAAAHGVLIALVPGQATIWNAALTTSLAAIPDGQAKTDGRLLGESIAAAMIALRASDGSAPPQSYAPPPPEPGGWQPTGSCSPAGGTNFHWGRLAPFGVPDIAPFRPGPPPALTSGAYAKAYAEVAEMGGADSATRPQDREDVARFYAAFSPVSWANSARRHVAAAGQASIAEKLARLRC